MTLVFEQYANSFESPKLSSLALFSVLAGPDITPPTSIGTSVRDKCQLQLGGSVQAKLIVKWFFKNLKRCGDVSEINDRIFFRLMKVYERSGKNRVCAGYEVKKQLNHHVFFLNFLIFS